ncbi:NAD(P)H-binding protein [Streptomyces sp. LP05-1]|uniref:NAD(P)H-binding protein n=1 Tax=Streptomyces pyxinae TaxID=2970734 RepID=A0ABT2CPH1_9ACTN|nr:NAD(P)H-binding protein [Streptomyces sp. LP05-1]MCS0639210.1 NAD(P)H-binding protein [Streptomyces sp. LP05-1]
MPSTDRFGEPAVQTAPTAPTVAVTTPTGAVGGEVAGALIRAGVRPRLLVRDARRLRPGHADHAEVIETDLSDRDGMLKATEGVDALYLVIPPTDADDPVGGYERLARIAAEAVTTNGVARTVLQSSVGAELRRGAGEIDGLGRAEELLDATGASVTHLRCGFFFSNLLMQLYAIQEGVIPVVLPTDHAMPWVAPRDIAEVAALRLLSGHWTGCHVRAVHGPEDLSWERAAEIVSEATGRPVRAERVPDDTMRAMLGSAGLTGAQAEAVLGMSTGLRDGFVPEQSRDTTTTTPTHLSGWAYEHLRPALAEL